MMRSSGYIDDNLVKNSVLACFILTSFTHRYEELTARTLSPDLMKILLVLPIVWHKSSCDAVRKKNTSSSLRSVVLENPVLRTGIQSRIDELAPLSLQALNLACASDLLKRHMIDGIPHVSSCFSRWPRGSKPTQAPPEMMQAIERLAFWFKENSTAEIFSLLLRE